MIPGDIVKLRYGNTTWLGRLVTMGPKTSVACFSPKTRELETVETRFLSKATQAEIDECPIKQGLDLLPMLPSEYAEAARA